MGPFYKKKSWQLFLSENLFEDIHVDEDLDEMGNTFRMQL